MIEHTSQSVRPGINPKVLLNRFDTEERIILERISKDWYITNGGDQIKLGPTSIYHYILVKPVDIFREMFNIDRELIVLFSPYESFEPRTLDALTNIINRHQLLRIERICSILISKDLQIESKLRDLLKNDQEAQIVVPFTYKELSNPISDPYFFRNRFINHFYARDLFASESPLKTDLYFFGRTNLVHTLVNRHLSNQVSGLFGLRKTGKTSVIYGIQRALKKNDSATVIIDCQNPSFHRQRWHDALIFVLNEIKKQNDLSCRMGGLSQPKESDVPILFEKYLIQMCNELNQKSILLIFDEIENITPGVSPTEHWRNGADFVYFWQTLRSLFQKNSSLFSYLLVGTNPLCVELPKFGNIENPIFAQTPLEYIPGFDVEDTREMVRKLGRIMGLQFDETIYSKLSEDFGGHPYLIRHVCSVINKLVAKEKRPVRVDKALYEEALEKFLNDYFQFIEMILCVLKEYFPDEYEMLQILSSGDMQSFLEFANSNPLYTNHLIGYGILQKVNDRFSFKTETIKKYLRIKEKNKRLHLNESEKWGEISDRRNYIEKNLRILCRMQLQAQLGESNAKESIEHLLSDKSSNSSCSYSDLFDPNKTKIYFSDLIKIIDKNWNIFCNIFGKDKIKVISHLKNLNIYRADAHAKSIDDNEFTVFRVSATFLEKIIQSFMK